MQTESLARKPTLFGAVRMAQSTEPSAMCLNSLNEYRDLKILKNIEKWMAEREGFEPSVRVKRTTVFETAPFNHSGISPCVLRGGAYILVPSDVNNGRAGIPPGGGAWPGIVFVGCHELTESAHTYITCALA